MLFNLIERKIIQIKNSFFFSKKENVLKVKLTLKFLMLNNYDGFLK